MKLFGFNTPNQNLDNTTEESFPYPKADDKRGSKAKSDPNLLETQELYNSDLEDEKRINKDAARHEYEYGGFKAAENATESFETAVFEDEANLDEVDDLLAKYAKYGVENIVNLDGLAKKCLDYMNDEAEKPSLKMDEIRELAIYYDNTHESNRSPFDESKQQLPLTKKETSFLSKKQIATLIALENEWRDASYADRNELNGITNKMNSILKFARTKAAEADQSEKKNKSKESKKAETKNEEPGNLQSDKRFAAGPEFIKSEREFAQKCIDYIFNKKDRPSSADNVPLDNFEIEEAALDYAEFLLEKKYWDKDKFARLKKSAEKMNEYNDKDLKIMENSANYLTTKKNRPFFEKGDVMTDEQIQEAANEYAEIKVERGEWGKGEFGVTTFQGRPQLESKINLPGGKSMKYIYSHQSPEGTYYFKVVSGIRANKKDPKKLTSFVDLKFEAKNPKAEKKAEAKPELKLVKKTDKIAENK